MHLYLKTPPIVDCPQCKEKKMMHRICEECGYYKGREVIDTLKRKKGGSSPSEDKKGEKASKPVSMESLSKKDKK